MDADIRAAVERASKESGLAISIELVSHYPAQPFHPECVQAVARAAEKLGYSNMPAGSGAGHHAGYMGRPAPPGVIFFPRKDGISPNEIEDPKTEHITPGGNVV